MHRIIAIFDTINEWAGRGLTLLVFACIAVVFIEVFNRYVVNNPSIWAHELSTSLWGAFGIGAGGYIMLHGGHITVDLITGRLSPRKRAMVEAWLSVFAFFVAVILIWKGFETFWYAVDVGERTQTEWGPLQWPLKMFLPLGGGLLVLGLLSKLVKDIAIARGGKMIVPESREEIE